MTIKVIFKNGAIADLENVEKFTITKIDDDCECNTCEFRHADPGFCKSLCYPQEEEE